MPTFTRQQALRDLDHHNAQLMLEIAQDTADTDTPLKAVRGATPAGDERKLRGIPALARGVGGAINGTIPHTSRITRG